MPSVLVQRSKFTPIRLTEYSPPLHRSGAGIERVKKLDTLQRRGLSLCGCAASPALPGCGARIMFRGLGAPRILRPLPLLRLTASAAGGARLCSFLRFPTIAKSAFLCLTATRTHFFALKVFQAIGTLRPQARFGGQPGRRPGS